MGLELLLLVPTGPALPAAGPRSAADEGVELAYEKLSEGERPPTSGMSEALDLGPDLAMMLVPSAAEVAGRSATTGERDAIQFRAACS